MSALPHCPTEGGGGLNQRPVDQQQVVLDLVRWVIGNEPRRLVGGKLKVDDPLQVIAVGESPAGLEPGDGESLIGPERFDLIRIERAVGIAGVNP
jgi:hypothetical protein